MINVVVISFELLTKPYKTMEEQNFIYFYINNGVECVTNSELVAIKRADVGTHIFKRETN